MSRKEKLQKLRQKLSGKQNALLKKRLSGQATTAPEIIPPRSQSGPVPLSFSQQRMWFLNQFEPDNPAYNEPEAVRLSGVLDVAALKRSLSEMVRRHEVLRTEFIIVDEQPMQRVKPAVDWHLELMDLSDSPASEQEVQVAQLATDSALRPFDLSQEQPLRTTLIRLSAQEHVFLLTMHHIISDGWSTGVFIKELATLYRAFSAGLPSPLPALPIQYADFSVWQNSYLQGETLKKRLAYWQEALQNLPTLAMPTDHRRPIQQTFNGARESFTLSSELTAGLQQLSRQEGVTLFMTLLAAFQTLLHRYTEQEDIVVGSPIANRNRPELEGLIGFFVNSLVLRTDLSGEPTFRDLLQRVREVTLSAYAHQDLPFELIVKELRLPRDLSRNPLFQIMFVLQNAPFSTLNLPHLTLSPLEVEYTTAKFDLELWMEEKAEGLQGTIEYNTDLFERATIERMVGHFQTLLMGIAANPLTPIARLPLLSKAEKHQLLVEWNNTSVPCPSDTCFHELFEAQVARTPDAPALLYQPPAESAQTDAPVVRLTYRELNERANQLAHHLRGVGIGTLNAEVVVGVCMERCPETVMSLLAIFKAGAVYIPLDPALPQERLSYMLSNSEAKVVLTKSQYASRLLEGDHQAQLLCFDTDWPLISENSLHNPINLSSPQNLAYVIYTSGSTGLPKGAMVEQQGMVNHLYTKIIDLKLTSNDRIAETAPASFDISIWQFLSGLLVGTAVHIFDDETVRNPAQLLARTESEKITILEVVPSLFRFMLDELATLGNHRPIFSSLRWVLLTGEALPPQLCREWLAYYPHIPLMNAYGPTECSDDVTHHAIYEPPAADAVTVPIGRAVPNMQLYILDRYLQPVPIGVPGELYVGGIGVGRGYLNDPERTAKAFMDDPFMPPQPWGGSTGRFYKTGDLVRYRPDSTIEFLGRLDHQVKIRGFRIELGEIEALLTKHESVREAIVIVHEAPSGANKQLVAYLVGEGADSSTLRSYLGQKLPDYMIPNVFVPLEAMPLTPNGKINRRALPAPDLDVDEKELLLPRTPVETSLVTIWQEVLGIKVGIHDNFFEIGGHSLLATRVVLRIRQHLKVDLPLRNLFEMPTVAELAELIDALQIPKGVQESHDASRERDTGEI